MEFIDLKSQYALIKDDVSARINRVLEHGQFIMGPEIKELESKLQEYTGTRHCISCSNGTDALLLGLMAHGVGPGDAIFTSPFTFIATAEVISLLGATPVFVDVDPRTFNLDPSKLKAAIANLEAGSKPSPGSPPGLKPRGVIGVDIFGLPADYEAINAIAKERGLFVIEDAAQSLGGRSLGKMAGSLAEIGATSFFPAKPLGCYGDGGAIFTSNDELAARMRSIRVHGQGEHKYDNVRIGINGRLDTLQAAILLAKMPVFLKEIEAKQTVAGRYDALLRGKTVTPLIPDGYRSAWAQYSILVDSREDIMNRLKAAGIPSMIYYPTPLHRQTAFSTLKYERGSLPISESVSSRIMSLPMHAYLAQADQERIAKVILEG